jgi:hypothetical protein
VQERLGTLGSALECTGDRACQTLSVLHWFPYQRLSDFPGFLIFVYFCAVLAEVWQRLLPIQIHFKCWSLAVAGNNVLLRVAIIESNGTHEKQIHNYMMFIPKDFIQGDRGWAVRCQHHRHGPTTIPSPKWEAAGCRGWEGQGQIKGQSSQHRPTVGCRECFPELLRRTFVKSQ